MKHVSNQMNIWGMMFVMVLPFSVYAETQKTKAIVYKDTVMRLFKANNVAGAQSELDKFYADKNISQDIKNFYMNEIQNQTGLMPSSLMVSTTKAPLSYTKQKIKEANNLIIDFKNKMDMWGKGIDKTLIDPKKIDETKDRFMQLQLPLMQAVKPLEELKEVKFTIQTGAFTATDVVPAVIDRKTGDVKGFIIIKRSDKQKDGSFKETYATIGGFHEYGLTCAQNSAKEAEEEVLVNIPVETMKFAGLFDDPMRDPRQHVMSIAYTGATYDDPQKTDEAREVLVVTEANLPVGPWFASDHRDIAQAAIKTFNANKDAIIAALKAANPKPFGTPAA